MESSRLIVLGTSLEDFLARLRQSAQDLNTAVVELEVWVRRRVRLYYWKLWKQPRTRRRKLIALGAA